VRKLADEIIEAQRREIAEMRYLIGAPMPELEFALDQALTVGYRGFWSCSS
jgi:hypothetical protein